MNLVEYLDDSIEVVSISDSFKTRGEFADYILSNLGWKILDHKSNLTQYEALDEKGHKISFDIFINYTTNKSPNATYKASFIIRDPYYGPKDTYITKHATKIAEKIENILNISGIDYRDVKTIKYIDMNSISIRFEKGKIPWPTRNQ